MSNAPHENDSRMEARIKQQERRIARYCRRFLYQTRRVLENDPSLTHLCARTDAVLPQLLKALERNTQLLRLDIYCCTLTLGGLVGRMLQRNRSLQLLRIKYCEVPPISMSTVFRCLTDNSTIETLDLSYSTGFFDRENTTLALCQALPNARGLKNLNLCATRLPATSAQSILEALQHNSTLLSLDISENPGIGETVVSSLVSYLPRMRLQAVNVEMTGVSARLDQQPKLMEGLTLALGQNSSLWKLHGIVVHNVDFYSDPKEKKAQQGCLDLYRQMRFYLFRNSVLDGNWLKIDQPSLWPWLLSHVLRAKSDFGRELTHFLLQEKCSSLLVSQDCDNETATVPHTKRRKRAEPVGRRIQKRPKRVCCESQWKSGFHCTIHGGYGMLPTECCRFEQMKPISCDQE